MSHPTKKDLKVGLLIWWTADRIFRGWDCPGVITYVNKRANTYRVLSFDDCKETDDLLIERSAGGDPSSLEEMRICTEDEVKKYFKKKKYTETPAALTKRILGEKNKKSTVIKI